MNRFLMLLFVMAFSLQAVDYAIVLPENAIPAEKTAGRELQQFLSRLSGKSTALVPHGERGSLNTFYLGQTPAAASALGLKDFTGFKPDEILLRRIGNDFYLTGSRPRGTLYAVYTFLEDFCGVRFFAPDETLYPEKFSLPATLDYCYAPAFIIRECPLPSLLQDSTFSARRKVNGHWQKTTVEWGGHEKILGFCHTFAMLMPPEKYAETHPEYYSEINGQRRPFGNQLCISNKEMRKELIRNVCAWLKKNPDTKVVSISQNDNKSYCQCRECKMLAAKYGNTQSGVLIDLLNELGASLEKEFPGVYFETLAYDYSVTAPENIRPRRNVLVRLCSNSCDYGRPLSHPVNAPFGNALKAWSKLTGRLMVWNYVSLFHNYIIPNPNWGLHGENLRFFRDNGTIAVFNQAGGTNNADFTPLRAYVNSKLLWNPDLEESLLIKEFIYGYYGKDAAPCLEKYLSLMKLDYAVLPADFKLEWNTRIEDWLPYEKLEQAMKLMEQAVSLSKGKYADRIKTAKTAINFAFLLHPETPDRYAKNLSVPQKIYREFCEQTRNDRNYGEGHDLNICKNSLAYLYGVKKSVDIADLPPQIQKFGPDNLVVVPPEEMTAWENKIRTERKDGFIRMRSDHKAWLIQFGDFAMRTRGKGQWQLFAEIRTGGNPAWKDKALEAGIYDRATKKANSRYYPYSAVAGKDFKLVDLGTYHFQSGKEYFFCAPVNDPRGEYIDIKRLILVKK